MIYAQNYILRKTDHILLYGAATTGAILHANLTKAGYCVAAFIDQRADEIDSYYGLPVWNIAAAGCYAEKQAAVVIIAVKNVFEHERIAGNLWDAGFEKIIYRPYRSVCGNETEADHMLNAVYDQIIDRDGITEVSPCPAVMGREQQPLKDHAIILDRGDYVTANIPAPYVFTDKYENQETLWGDIPCLGLLPHRALFDVFNGKWNPDYVEYMNYCRQAAERCGGIVTSEAWEASVYQNRIDVFNHMQYSWEHNRDFFIKNAVEGVYNPKGYFNIRSGKHRIAYMLTKGSRYIPLKINKKDYETWRSREHAVHIANYLWENHIETLPVVLTNPYFYDFTSTSPAFYERVLFTLLPEIYRDSFYSQNNFCFKGKKLLFDHTPMALYAEIFRMIGFEIYICESDPIHMELNKAVLPASVFNILETLDAGPGRYDIAISEGAVSRETISAHLTITICGNVQDSKKPFACGRFGENLLYAFSSTDP